MASAPRDQRSCDSAPCPHDQWHLDVIFVLIRDRHTNLWRAVNLESEVLDFLVQSRCKTCHSKSGVPSARPPTESRLREGQVLVFSQPKCYQALWIVVTARYDYLISGVSRRVNSFDICQHSDPNIMPLKKNLVAQRFGQQ